MISFQDGPKPRNYLSRGEQRRILFLVMSLGLVLILMCEAAKVKNWQWFADLDKNRDAEEENWQWFDETAKNKAPGSVGFLPDDKENSESPPAPGERRSYFPGVDEKLLKSITDNTRTRNEEDDAWFNLMGVLKRADESELRRSSCGRVTWLQLKEQSNEYRGELVTVRGTVRRAHRLEAPKNNEEIQGYFRLWLQPDDNLKQPIVIYSLELPEGFPTGLELDERARATGFFFKNWLYMGQDDLQTAPVVLTKTVDWQKKPAAPAKNEVPYAVNSIYFIVALAAGLSLLVIFYILYCTRGRRREEESGTVDLNFDIKTKPEEESRNTEEEQEK